MKVLILLCTLLVCGVAWAQAPNSTTAGYPARPIHLIVPYPAGGGADHWARLVSSKLGEKLHQPVMVENLPGHGGNDGTTAAARATPDGYTLLLGSVGPLVVHQFTYSSLTFDPQHDFTPIALLESSPIVLVAARDAQVSSARELIDLARSHPSVLSYASNGNGSPEQVAGELFKRRLGLEIRHVPFNGAGPARKAVLAGEASLMFDPCKGALPAIREGLQRPLAVAAPTRLVGLADVPTFAEIGVRNYELRIWTGVLAPVGTPKDVILKVNAAVQDILRTPEIRQEIENEGGQAGATTPEAFQTFLSADRVHWRELVDESGVPKVM
ncbi:MAG TPA: tripartite tricarboxylate transporter substrate binding protein [Steroidobacteraceae bacterium]